MGNAEILNVCLGDRLVGQMAETADHRYAFEYDARWLEDGFSISPFSLPLEKQVFTPSKTVFDGLWGVFADSLPDAWGRLLVDRMLLHRGIDPNAVSPLERLSVVGDSGMGALCYRPAWDVRRSVAINDFDRLAAECRALLNREEPADLDEVFQLGGSSGGARPKVVMPEWIVKFPVTGDRADVGVMEKAYMDCAARCGINVPETRLIPSQRCDGYFAVRRFDRLPGGHRVHMLTVSAMLEIDHRTPSLDYHTLMKLTRIVCRDDPEDILQMFRRACFNVFAHNRDDHAKNFAFVYDPERDAWHVSPAYDLTRSTTYWGQHTTTVDGNGRDPGRAELIAVGRAAGLSPSVSKNIVEEVFEKTRGLSERFE